LVDTSVWIDHLHAPISPLVSRLDGDEVGCHPLVVEELALGSIRNRDVVLSSLQSLQSFPTLTHSELRDLVDRRRLWGRGLTAVDVHLLGSALVASGTLWTRDKRLNATARELGVPTMRAGKT
ncbi:MAG TPA: type II toxin-antitoxin system VapC family toxin, partial [Jatrophihabitantaceae bacterium]|nr:type II toxin-antitoxin system VapC family toxin [Jatrophihabitantaceae bacterium]